MSSGGGGLSLIREKDEETSYIYYKRQPGHLSNKACHHWAGRRKDARKKEALGEGLEEPRSEGSWEQKG